MAGRRSCHQVTLWAFEKEVCASIQKSGANDVFLPEHPIPKTVQATNDLKEALAGTEIVVSVMPSNHCRRVFEHMTQWLLPQMIFVSATKGVENDTLLRMTEVIHEVVSRFSGFTPKLAALSGPSFAKEVAKGITHGRRVRKSAEPVKWKACHPVLLPPIAMIPAAASARMSASL